MSETTKKMTFDVVSKRVSSEGSKVLRIAKIHRLVLIPT